MTRTRPISWVSTLALCLTHAAGAAVRLVQRPVVETGSARFGIPADPIDVLMVARIAAPLAILSRFSVRPGDLACAVLLCHLLLALSAHPIAGDGGYVPANLALVLLALSLLTRNAAR